jgi:hypothetical protein
MSKPRIEAVRTKTGKFVPCTGEAHSNAFIDHCSLCAPRWGQVEVMEPVDLLAAMEAGHDVPAGELTEPQMEFAEHLVKAGRAVWTHVERATKRSKRFYVVLRFVKGGAS